MITWECYKNRYIWGGVKTIKEAFIERTFRKKSLERIEQITKILDEYEEQGLTLTLRQLYYQLVSRDIIPNSQDEYNKVGDLVRNARRAGLIDWRMIEDRTRYLRGYATYINPRYAIMDTVYQYKIDLWEDQNTHVEVWVEKDALIDVVGRACDQYRVDYFSCRGFTSDSETYRAGKRMKRYIEDGKRVVLLHLGDHDPSGIDMSRDILERLNLFSGKSGLIDFRRIALTMKQVQKYSPPPNPAKETDKRFQSYVKKYGSTSWELDALEPSVLMGVIQENILDVMDRSKFLDRQRLEEEQRQQMLDFAQKWA